MKSGSDNHNDPSLSSVTSDGSPVAVYRALPTMGEPEIILAASRPRASILELGCGAGRITHALVKLGHPVVAVDNSTEMLRHVRGAETVLGDIESLNLGRTFDTVVLGGHFINDCDESKRIAMLKTCVRHVAPGGVVLVQRYVPDLLRTSTFPPTKMGDVTCSFSVRSVDRSTQAFSATATYQLGSQKWEQHFEAQILSDEVFCRTAGVAGLELLRWLDDKRTWAALQLCEDAAG